MRTLCLFVHLLSYHHFFPACLYILKLLQSVSFVMCIHCYTCETHHCPRCLCSCWDHPFQCQDQEDCYNNHISNHINQLQNKFEDYEVDGYPTHTPEEQVSNDVIFVEQPNPDKKRLANHNKSTGQAIQSTTKMICNTPAKTKRESSTVRRPTKSTSKPSNRYSPTKIRPRTSRNNDESLPSSSSKCKRKLNLDITHKHEQQKNKTRSN